MFAAFALLSATDRSNAKRLGNWAFWHLMATSLLAGDVIRDFGNGLLVLGLAASAGFGLIGRGSPPTTSEAERERSTDDDRSLFVLDLSCRNSAWRAAVERLKY